MELLAKDAALITLLTAASWKITVTPEDYSFQASDATAVAAKVTAAQNAMEDASTYKTLTQPKVAMLQFARMILLPPE